MKPPAAEETNVASSSLRGLFSFRLDAPLRRRAIALFERLGHRRTVFLTRGEDSALRTSYSAHSAPAQLAAVPPDVTIRVAEGHSAVPQSAS